MRDVTLENSAKGDEIQEAAAFVCYPMSDVWRGDDSWTSEIPILQEVMKLPGAEAFTDALDSTEFARRFAYARQNTAVRLIVEGKEAGTHAFGGGSLVTVEVTHDYSLRIAIAARVFASRKESWGYISAVKGQATLLYEGASELVPEGAPSGAQP